MTIIEVHSDVQYNVHRPSTFIFAVLAAHNAHQTVLDEKLIVQPHPARPAVFLEACGTSEVRHPSRNTQPAGEEPDRDPFYREAVRLPG